jgi:hypothetical protein
MFNNLECSRKVLTCVCLHFMCGLVPHRPEAMQDCCASWSQITILNKTINSLLQIVSRSFSLLANDLDKSPYSNTRKHIHVVAKSFPCLSVHQFDMEWEMPDVGEWRPADCSPWIQYLFHRHQDIAFIVIAVHLFISVQKAKGLTSFTLNDTPSSSSNAIVGPIPNGFVDAVQDPVPCLSGTRLAFEPINRFLSTIHVIDRDYRDINASMIPFAATGIRISLFITLLIAIAIRRT